VSIFGNRVVRVEDPRLLTGGARYVENIALPGEAAWVGFVRSPLAHARIAAIDDGAARAMPGVLGVFRGADLAGLGPVPHVLPAFPEPMRRPLLAIDVVRFAGEPIVAIVARDRYVASDAVESVVVDFEPLDAVIDPETALLDEVLLFPEAGTNTVVKFESPSHADFSSCEVIVELRIENQRMTAGPLETRSGAAYWTRDGRLVHYSACQGAHPTRDLLAQIYALDKSMVRVVVPDMGGGFGAKSRTYADELALGWLSRAVDRPVRYTETRTENMLSMPQGRGQVQYAKLGGTP